MNIRHASFTRLGYSGEEKFAEAEVMMEGADTPLIVTFQSGPDGTLELVNVSEKREDFELDWYDNSLHSAYVSVAEQLFGVGRSAEAKREKFAEEVLAFEDLREAIEDAFYYGSP